MHSENGVLLVMLCIKCQIYVISRSLELCRISVVKIWPPRSRRSRIYILKWGRSWSWSQIWEKVAAITWKNLNVNWPKI